MGHQKQQGQRRHNGKVVGEVLRIAVAWALADEEQEKLRQLVERRDDLIKMRTQEKNRFQGPAADYIRPSVENMLNYLEKEIENCIDTINNNGGF